jgi:(E)-4-hydroxy-3-methylbut-2-enyl-diphosphate synthase
MDENSKSITPKSDKEVFLDSILESTLLSIQKAEEFGLPRNRIIISAKLSDVQDVIAINEMISAKTDCPLHL